MLPCRKQIWPTRQGNRYFRHFPVLPESAMPRQDDKAKTSLTHDSAVRIGGGGGRARGKKNHWLVTSRQ